MKSPSLLAALALALGLCLWWSLSARTQEVAPIDDVAVAPESGPEGRVAREAAPSDAQRSTPVRVDLSTPRGSDRAHAAPERGLAPGARVTVRGRVVDPGDGPASGATVWVGRDRRAPDRVETMTAADGAFELTFLGTGAARIGVVNSGHAPLAQDLDLGEGVADVYVVLRLGGPREVRGIVQDERGRALPGAHVRLGTISGSVIAERVTGEDGRFAFTTASLGVIRIVGVAAGFARSERGVPYAHDSEDDVVLVLRRSGVLRGVVVDDATGAPLTDFVVRIEAPRDVQRQPTARGFDVSWFEPGHTFRTAAGRWETGDDTSLQPDGWATVVVTAAGYAPARLEAVPVVPSDAASLIEHRLVRPVEVELVVVMAGSGEPVMDALVEWSETPRFGRPAPRGSARTDTTGSASLTDVTPGELHVRVTRAQRAPHVLGPFEVTARAERAPLRVEVPGGATVAVALRQENGAPLSEHPARLTALQVRGVAEGASIEARSGPDGVARFEEVPAGRWSAGQVNDAAGQTYRARRRTFEVAAGAEQVEVELAPLGTSVLHGAVLVDGQLPELLVVSATNDDGAGCAALVRDGRYEVTGLAPGWYRVVAQDLATGEVRASDFVTLPNDTLRVEQRLILRTR